MFRAILCPSSGADDLVVFFSCDVVPWLCRQSDPVGWLCVHREVRSTLRSATCYVLPYGHTTSQPDLTAYTATARYVVQRAITSLWTHNQPTGSDCLHSHGTTPHVKNTTKSSAPVDGHKVSRNMLSNLSRSTYKGEINIILSDI